MRHKIVTSFLIVAVFSTPELSHGSGISKWNFIDLKSGGSAELSQVDGTFVVAESAESASFCASDSVFRCFETNKFSFAIPRNARHLESWAVNGRIYCVAQRFPDAHNKERENSSWLIFSRKGDKCGGMEGYDQSAVYSLSAGLRYMSTEIGENGSGEMYAIDGRGFAAKWVR